MLCTYDCLKLLLVWLGFTQCDLFQLFLPDDHVGYPGCINGRMTYICLGQLCLGDKDITARKQGYWRFFLTTFLWRYLGVLFPLPACGSSSFWRCNDTQMS